MLKNDESQKIFTETVQDQQVESTALKKIPRMYMKTPTLNYCNIIQKNDQYLNVLVKERKRLFFNKDSLNEDCVIIK